MNIDFVVHPFYGGRRSHHFIGLLIVPFRQVTLRALDIHYAITYLIALSATEACILALRDPIQDLEQ